MGKKMFFGFNSFEEGLAAFVTTTYKLSNFTFGKLNFLDVKKRRVIVGGDALPQTIYNVDFDGKLIDLTSNTNVATLQINDATNLREMDISSKNITSVDISNCPNLTILSLYSNRMVSLDLSNNPLITFLNIGVNSTFNTVINLANVPLLETFQASKTEIPSGLYFSNTPNIVSVHMTRNNAYDGIFNFAGCINLKTITLTLTSWTPSGKDVFVDCIALESFTARATNAQNVVGRLNLSNNVNLKTLDLGANLYDDASFPFLTNNINLTYLNLYSSSSMTTIDLTNNTKLIKLYCQLNTSMISIIGFSNLIKLKTFTIEGSGFPTSSVNNFLLNLDANGLSSGSFVYTSNSGQPTRTQNTTDDVFNAYNSLISKSWSIVGNAPI